MAYLIIKLVPFLVDIAGAVGGVVTSIQATEVVGYCIQIEPAEKNWY